MVVERGADADVDELCARPSGRVTLARPPLFPPRASLSTLPLDLNFALQKN